MIKPDQTLRPGSRVRVRLRESQIGTLVVKRVPSPFSKEIKKMEKEALAASDEWVRNSLHKAIEAKKEEERRFLERKLSTDPRAFVGRVVSLVDNKSARGVLKKHLPSVTGSDLETMQITMVVDFPGLTTPRGIFIGQWEKDADRWELIEEK